MTQFTKIYKIRYYPLKCFLILSEMEVNSPSASDMTAENEPEHEQDSGYKDGFKNQRRGLLFSPLFHSVANI